MVTNAKNCYCYTCKREFHYLGIARHRAMHRDKKEDCEILFSDGSIYLWHYAERPNTRLESDAADGAAQPC